MGERKNYVVWVGKQPGIYVNWISTKKQFKGFKNPKYKSFDSRENARLAFRIGYDKVMDMQKVMLENKLGEIAEMRLNAIERAKNLGKDSILVTVPNEALMPLNFMFIIWGSSGEIISEHYYCKIIQPSILGYLGIGSVILTYKGSVKRVYCTSQLSCEWITSNEIDPIILEGLDPGLLEKTKPLQEVIRKTGHDCEVIYIN